MGTLLPKLGNINYSGAGVLSPLTNDPDLECIGLGTRIFLCGAQGYVIGSGTQHDPEKGFSTLMVKGDLKEMSTKYLRGATFHRYAPTLYVGIGVPIPILNESIAEKTAVRDSEITTEIIDYSVPRRSRPSVLEVSYEELKSGIIDLNGKEVKTSPLSSFYMAREIAAALGDMIKKGEFFLSSPVERLSKSGRNMPMKQTKEFPMVGDVMSRNVVTVRESISISEAARAIIDGSFDHLPVVSEDEKLIGIVTAWDISKAVARERITRVSEIMTRKVVSATLDEPIELAARKLDTNRISALPVVDREGHVLGMITSNDLSRLFARRRSS
jgi:CBS domain-containing protein